MHSSPKHLPKPGLEQSPLIEEDMSDGQLEQLISDCEALEKVVDDARGYTRSGVPSKHYPFTQTSAAKVLAKTGYLRIRIHIANEFQHLRRDLSGGIGSKWADDFTESATLFRSMLASIPPKVNPDSVPNQNADRSQAKDRPISPESVLREATPEDPAKITAAYMKRITRMRNQAYSDVTVLNDFLTRMEVGETSFLRPTHSAQFELDRSPGPDSRAGDQKGGKRHGGEPGDQSVENGADKRWLNSTQRTIKVEQHTYYRTKVADVFKKLRPITACQREVAILRYGYSIESDKTMGEILHLSRKSVYARMKGLKAKLRQPSVMEELKHILVQHGETELAEGIEKLLKK